MRRIAHAVLFVALVAGGYRIVNYRLPLIPGAIAYIRLRLQPDADGRP